jgi:predicted nucleic-acid-binding Zn-ribbon protein
MTDSRRLLEEQLVILDNKAGYLDKKLDELFERLNKILCGERENEKKDIILSGSFVDALIDLQISISQTTNVVQSILNRFKKEGR